MPVMARQGALPAPIRQLFWDLNPGALRWDRDREMIIGRVLAVGTWSAVQWLRQRTDDETLKDWILRHEGRGLSPQQLRFWQLILGLPARRVDAWLRDERRQVWDRR
jgi:uncharacterized protein DUF6922